MLASLGDVAVLQMVEQGGEVEVERKVVVRLETETSCTPQGGTQNKISPPPSYKVFYSAIH